MGSKNLKAVVTGGDRKQTVADAETLDFIVYEARKVIKQSPITSIGLPTYGTSALVRVMDMMGAFPTFNFTECTFEHLADVSGETLRERFLVKQKACWGCPIGCKRGTKTRHGEGEGPEYESLWALGPECGIHDLEAITDANYLCNRLGLDTISTGVTIGCSMEMTQRGIIDGVYSLVMLLLSSVLLRISPTVAIKVMKWQKAPAVLRKNTELKNMRCK